MLIYWLSQQCRALIVKTSPCSYHPILRSQIADLTSHWSGVRAQACHHQSALDPSNRGGALRQSYNCWLWTRNSELKQIDFQPHNVQIHYYPRSDYTIAASHILSTSQKCKYLGRPSKKKLRNFGHMSKRCHPTYLVPWYGQDKV